MLIIVSVKDANGNVTQYEYDENNLRTNVKLPLDMSSKMVYNNYSELTESIDFNGRRTGYSI